MMICNNCGKGIHESKYGWRHDSVEGIPLYACSYDDYDDVDADPKFIPDGVLIVEDTDDV